jgi:A/G-specific adenine glycosylase
VNTETQVRPVRECDANMLQGRRLTEFREQLLEWFRQFQRDLPWRRTHDPYRIWLSEIMLQQTRVAAVIPYYQRFLERFPNVQSLAEASEEEVLRFWSGLGYYSRGRNLQRAAQVIVAKHGGAFPRTEPELLALPGIGPYTAAAILSIAFASKHAVLDGNVARVVARLGAIGGDLRDSPRWQELQSTADHLLDQRSPSDWNQAMMELGAMVCTPRSPQCLLCPVTRFCRARQLGLAESIPEKRKLREKIQITLASAVLLDGNGRTLLLPPPQAVPEHTTGEEVAALVSKMWHFPTVSVQKNPVAELRIFLKELSLTPKREAAKHLAPLPRVRHTVTYRDIVLLPFRVLVTKLPRMHAAKRILLLELASLSSLAVSNLTRKVARAALSESVS